MVCSTPLSPAPKDEFKTPRSVLLFLPFGPPGFLYIMTFDAPLSGRQSQFSPQELPPQALLLFFAFISLPCPLILYFHITPLFLISGPSR